MSRRRRGPARLAAASLTAAVVLAALAVAIAGCALDEEEGWDEEGWDEEGGLEDDVGSASQEIVGGSTVSGWPAVGYMTDNHTRCTATLVSPNVMVTAAHCTLRGTEIRVGFGAYRHFEELTIRARRVIRAPGYAAGSEPTHDVAVLVIDQPQWHAPIPRAGDAPAVGRELRVVGYGDDESGITEPEGAGSNRPRKTAHVVVTDSNWWWLATRGAGGAGCFGDSGGPLMDLDGTRIFGVMSQVWLPCTSTTRNSFASVVHEGFIAEAIRDHPPAPREWGTVLWRYWNPTNADHFYTIDRNDAGLAWFGYTIEKGEGIVFRWQFPGTVPLYRYWNPGIGDHFYTTNFGELGWGNYGWTLEKVEAYVFARDYTGVTGLHRYWNPSNGDHFYSTTRNDAGYAYFGYGYEGVGAWVYP